MANTYKMTIAGLERELPICPVSDKLDIAAFVMFSDVEVTVKSAEELLKKCPDFDIIITDHVFVECGKIHILSSVI